MRSYSVIRMAEEGKKINKDLEIKIRPLKEMGKISKSLESLYEKHPGVKPFEGITDPVRWQREMRDEWE